MCIVPLSFRWRAVLAGLVSVLCMLAAPSQAADSSQLSDPPSRVLRLNNLSGTASFAPAGSDDWVSATLNRPLTEGDRLWVEKGERAELHVGATALRLAGSSGLEILELSDTDLKLKITQGSFSIRVRDYPDDENIEIDTPNLSFEIRSPGEYRFDVDPDHDTTTLSVRRGSGSAYGDDEARPPVKVSGGQRVRFDGRDLFTLESTSVGPRDEFDRWAAQRDDREDASKSARYVSRDMTGYEDLDEYGDWRDEPGYGSVWVPRVTISAWAPYHYGHWAWIVPWGWTWVDDAPWGFAPFHYGRWAHFGSYWGWVPGPVARRPVYAPALVAFVGGGSGSVSWGISLSSGLPGVAWFALGPNEPYRPAYHHRPEYLVRVNPHITVNRTVNVYVNQRAPHGVAVMPERDFVRGAPMRPGQTAPVRDRDLTRLPVREALPVAPLRESTRGGAAPSRNIPPERAFRPSAFGQRIERPRENGRGPATEPRDRRENSSERAPAARSETPMRNQPRETRPSEDGRRQENEANERRQQQDQQRQQEQGRRQQEQQQQESQRQQQEQRRQQEQQVQQRQQQEQDQQRRQQQDQQRQQEQGRRQQEQQQQESQRQQQEQRRQQEQQVQQRQQEQMQRQQEQMQRQQQDQQRQQEFTRRQQEQQQQESQRQQQEQRRQQEVQQRQPERRQEERRPEQRKEDEQRQEGGRGGRGR